jgi:predicted Zn-dependent protease
MKNWTGSCVLAGLLIISSTSAIGNRTPASQTTKPTSQKNDFLLSTMQQELQRAQSALGRLDPAPYFASYSVYDQNLTVVFASQGSLMNSTRARRRSANVIVRVGNSSLDNSHGDSRASAINSGLLPLDDDPDAVAHALWQLTYGEYRKASQAYLNAKTSAQVHAQEEDTSPDFSQETPQSYVDSKEVAATVVPPDYEQMVRKCSAAFSKYPYIYSSLAVLTAQTTHFYFVSTEGSRVLTSNSVVRLAIQAETRADDGMELMRFETFQASSPDRLPGETEIAARVEKMASDLKDLRTAPVAEPFDGPALLSGRSAAVFFHEVLGHRLEGSHQRGEQEGQTFTKKLNQSVLPDFLSVIDDPTQRSLNGTELSGWYEYDDEGVPASRVAMIDKGILKSFLMSRMPVKDFAKSNGHGRAQPGLMPIGRQGNLAVISSNKIKDSELRQRLIEEIKKQGKPYGLYFEDIQGGFTLTQRSLPQAFQVLPVMVWRVYPDGRPDELVRGVNIVGTPIAALNRILLTGEKTDIFNGICGAESGSVPVSASAPAMLFSEIEVQKQPHSLNRPPILPPPGFEDLGSSTPAKTGGMQ